MMKKVIITLLLLLCILGQGFSQTFKENVAKGDSCFKKRNLHAAVSFYKQALKIKPERLLSDLEEISISLKLGDTYFEITDYQASMNCYFRYLNLKLVEDNDSIKCIVYNRIARSYSSLKRLDQGLVFLKKASEICQEDDIKMQGVINNNMADIYFEIGDYETAKKHFKLAHDFFVQADYIEGLIVININFGNLAQKENKIAFAKKFIEKAESIATKNTDTTFIVISQLYLAEYYLNISDYENAESQLNWTLKNATKYNMPEYISKSYKNLVKLYEEQKKYKKAFRYLKLFKQSSDSIFNINLNRNYADLEAQYSIREKKKENELLKKNQQLSTSKVLAQRKYIWLLSILFAVTTLLLAYIFYQRQKRAKARELLEIQNKTIKKSQKQLKDLNYQYEKLIVKYENGESSNKPTVEIS